MISPELVAQIRRLYAVEGWKRNTIARHLRVHHGTVSRALGLVSEPLCGGKIKERRPSRLDAFVPWLKEQLGRYPELSSSHLYEMARKRGYVGGPDHFRHRLVELELRPRRTPEAFFELRTLPGEQAQVDWAHFGSHAVPGGRRNLFAFVLVLSYSRWLFVRFSYDARLPSFLSGHVEAFSHFGGVPRLLLYDNLKSAVLERVDQAVRFHPRLLQLADHYQFEPRPVAPRRGNEKGRVERAIRYLRTAFFPLRQGLDLLTLNREADHWCREQAGRRAWPQQRIRTVEQAFLEERSQLLALPAEPFPCHEVVTAEVRRTPLVRFDTNRYSVPHDHIDRTLTLLAEQDRVRIFDRQELIAEHPRSWGKDQLIEEPRHTDALWQSKHHARQHRAQNRLLVAVPQTQQLLTALAQSQRHLRPAVEALLRLLDEHGASELEVAVTEALRAGSPHLEAVRLVLERRRHQRGQSPPLPVALPDDERVRNLVVKPHVLADYDPEEENG